MDLSFTDEQQMLRDLVDRYMRERYDRRGHAAAQVPGQEWSRQAWRDFAQMGLLGLPFPEEYGGAGATPVETMLVMEALGAGPALEPFFASVVLAGHAILLGGTGDHKRKLLPAIASGEHVAAFAHSEAQARYELADVQTRAVASGPDWRLTGSKALVLHGPSANTFVVSARTSGAQRDEQGISLFLVQADAPGLTVTAYETQDGSSAADLVLQDVDASPLGGIGQGLPIVAHVADIAIAALAAELVGCMQALHDLTLEHLKTREQFGVPLGTFQVLQHRAVDMLVSLEQARSMAMYAATMAGHRDPRVRAAAMSAVKYQVGKAARHVGHQAIQLHGGLGITAECSVGRYFLRTLVDETLFGDSAHHLARLSAYTRTNRLPATA